VKPLISICIIKIIVDISVEFKVFPCFIVSAKLGNLEEEKLSVVSDLESILTYQRKVSQKEYRAGNGWIELLLPVIALKVPRNETGAIFQAILNKYIPRGKTAYSLLRLLILYHDPKLCSFLDTKRITPESYAQPWVSLDSLIHNINKI
jgi:hypothetical protein